jgi:hypothetical protein
LSWPGAAEGFQSVSINEFPVCQMVVGGKNLAKCGPPKVAQTAYLLFSRQFDLSDSNKS